MTRAVPTVLRKALRIAKGGARPDAGHLRLVTGVALLAVLSLLLPSPARAHAGSSGTPGFTSRVVGIEPAVAGLDVKVVAGDDRLRLKSDGSSVVVIDGYDGEPYLRFQADGVYENIHSPAVYLNEERYGKVELPSDADSKAEPEWKQISNAPFYEWHDHRIHWMSPILPPVVSSAPKEPHHVFDWTVPGTVEGKQLAISGTLDYSPPKRTALGILLIPVVGALLLAGGVFAWAYRRRRRLR